MVLIRKAKKEDVDSIVQLMCDLQTAHIGLLVSDIEKKYIEKKANVSELWKSSIEKSLQNNSELLLVAEVDTKLVGYLKAEIKQRSQVHKHGRKLYIRYLIVSEKHRSRGIGTALIKEAERFAKTKNIPFMTLKTSPKNNPTRGSYKSMGFEDIYVEMIKGCDI